jgi:hypothetical protein
VRAWRAIQPLCRVSTTTATPKDSRIEQLLPVPVKDSSSNLAYEKIRQIECCREEVRPGIGRLRTSIGDRVAPAASRPPLFFHRSSMLWPIVVDHTFSDVRNVSSQRPAVCEERARLPLRDLVEAREHGGKVAIVIFREELWDRRTGSLSAPPSGIARQRIEPRGRLGSTRSRQRHVRGNSSLCPARRSNLVQSTLDSAVNRAQETQQVRQEGRPSGWWNRAFLPQVHFFSD